MTKRDVEAYLGPGRERPRRAGRDARCAGDRPAPAGAPRRNPRAEARGTAPAPALSPRSAAAEEGETVEADVGRCRKGIAEHMRRSLDSPRTSRERRGRHDAGVVGSAQKLKPEFQDAYGVDLSCLAFIVRAAVEARPRLAVDQRRGSRRRRS